MKTYPVRCWGLRRGQRPPVVARAMGWHCSAPLLLWLAPQLWSAPAAGTAWPHTPVSDWGWRCWLQYVTHSLFFPICALLDKDK